MPAKKKQTKTKKTIKKTVAKKKTTAKKAVKKVSRPKKKVTKKRAVRVKLKKADKSKLSPYTIYLGRPRAKKDAATEEAVKISASNFVEYVGLLDDPALLEAVKEDLAIDDADLAAQLAEKDLIAVPKPLSERLPKPSLPKFDLKQVKARAEELFARVPEEEPEDIYAALDLEGIEEVDEVEEVEVKEPQFVFSFDESGEPSIIEAIEEEVEVVVEEVGRTARRWTWQLEHGWKRAIAAFVLVSFVFVLPLHAMSTYRNLRSSQADLEQAGYSALDNLGAAAGAALGSDFSAAATSFTQASQNFERAQETLGSLDASLRTMISVLPATRRAYQSGAELLKAGESLSRAATRLADAFAAMQNEINPTMVSRIEILETTLERTLPILEEAETHLANVESDLIPEEAQVVLDNITLTLPTLITTFEEFLTFSEMIKTILGDDVKRRYLVIFQNNTELRPTGGFIGSFAEIDVYQGEITKITVPAGGSYDLQGSLSEYLIAPEPLQLINARWEFQDANWFPDFPASAQKLVWFYEEAGGPTVDGVIAVNATYIADLLNLLGPIDMPEYERTIDSENFMFETQKIVEIEADKTAPKQFIGDLAPKLLERVTDADADGFLSTLTHVSHGLASKDIQLYFADHELEQTITELGWAGEIKKPAGDYLMVVTTNIGGGKTDGIIDEDIDLQVEIAEDGTITNTVTVTRTHPGIKSELFTGVNNVDYIRLYVPRGSQLLHASNFEIPPPELFERPPNFYEEDQDLSFAAASTFIDPVSGTTISEEFGKTVFGNWIQTKPGETEVATFTYQLPWKVQSLAVEEGWMTKVKNWFGLQPTETYSLFLQKQSGVINRDISVELMTPRSLDIIWASSENIQDGTVEFGVDGQTDTFLGILLEHNP